MITDDLFIPILTSGAVATVVTGLFQWSVQARIQKEVDRHKHDLEKLMLTTKLKADKQFTIYPEVDVKLHAALGHARQVNFSRDDISQFSDLALRDELASWEPPLAKQTLEEVATRAADLAGDARSRYLQAVVREYEGNSAFKSYRDANNYVVSVGLFLDPEVYAAAIDTLAAILAALRAGRRQPRSAESMAALATAQTKVQQVRELLRKSLEGEAP